MHILQQGTAAKGRLFFLEALSGGELWDRSGKNGDFSAGCLESIAKSAKFIYNKKINLHDSTPVFRRAGSVRQAHAGNGGFCHERWLETGGICKFIPFGDPE